MTARLSALAVAQIAEIETCRRALRLVEEHAPEDEQIAALAAYDCAVALVALEEARERARTAMALVVEGRAA